MTLRIPASPGVIHDIEPVPVEQWPYAGIPRQRLGATAVVEEFDTSELTGIAPERNGKEHKFGEADYEHFIELQHTAVGSLGEAVMEDPNRITVKKPTRKITGYRGEGYGQPIMSNSGPYVFGSWRVGVGPDADGGIKPVASFVTLEMGRSSAANDMFGASFHFDNHEEPYKIERISRTDYDLKRAPSAADIPAGVSTLTYGDQEGWYIDNREGRELGSAEVVGIPDPERIKRDAAIDAKQVLQDLVRGDIAEGYGQATARDEAATGRSRKTSVSKAIGKVLFGGDQATAYAAFTKTLPHSKLEPEVRSAASVLMADIMKDNPGVVRSIATDSETSKKVLRYMVHYCDAMTAAGLAPHAYAERIKFLNRSVLDIESLWGLRKQDALELATAARIEKTVPQLMKTLGLINDTVQSTGPIDGPETPRTWKKWLKGSEEAPRWTSRFTLPDVAQRRRGPVTR